MTVATSSDTADMSAPPVLYGYQQEVVESAWKHVGPSAPPIGSGPARHMTQMPTSTGKTPCAVALLARWHDERPNDALLWFTHRDELKRQQTRWFERFGLDVYDPCAGVRGKDRVYKPGAVNLLMSSTRMLPRLPPGCSPGLGVFDEAHHSPAPTWNRMLDLWGAPLSGWTATPWRMNPREGFAGWHLLHCGPQPEWFADNGYIARVEVVNPSVAIPEESLTRKRGTPHGYDEGSVTQAVTRLMETGMIPSEWDRLTNGCIDRRTLWSTCTQSHAREMAEQIERDGMGEARVLLADTPRDERKILLDRFASGSLLHLVYVNVLSEGIDVPACGIVALVRPTLSLPVFLQQVGRGTRAKDGGGICTVVDFAGVVQQLGHPQLPRHWQLAPRDDSPKGSRSGEEPVSPCWNCGSPEHPSVRECSFCKALLWFDCVGDRSKRPPLIGCRTRHHRRFVHPGTDSTCLTCSAAWTQKYAASPDDIARAVSALGLRGELWHRRPADQARLGGDAMWGRGRPVIVAKMRTDPLLFDPEVRRVYAWVTRSGPERWLRARIGERDADNAECLPDAWDVPVRAPSDAGWMIEQALYLRFTGRARPGRNPSRRRTRRVSRRVPNRRQ